MANVEVTAPPGPYYDLRNYGLALDGSGQSAALVALMARLGGGVYVVGPGAVLGLDDPAGLSVPDDTTLGVVPSGELRYVGAAAGTIVSGKTSTPTVRSCVMGLGGVGKVNPNGLAGVGFACHSQQLCGIRDVDVLDGPAGFVGLQLLADAAAAGGKFGTKNTAHSWYERITFGTCDYGVTTLGSPGRVTNVTLADILVYDPRVVGFDFGVNTDTITGVGELRARPNVNNTIGFRWAASAQCYGYELQRVVADTPGGATGRQGLVAGNGCSRIAMDNYWNNPAADGGSIVDNGATPTPFSIRSGSWGTGGAASALLSFDQVRYPTTALFALTYGATVNSDAGHLPSVGGVFTLVVTSGTIVTIANPTNLSPGQTITYDIKNSSGGAMGAITWGAAFLLAGAFVNPANTKRRTITFYYDGTNLVERNRAAADI